METYDEIREKLIARREELMGQVKKIESNLRRRHAPLEKDSQERAQELENEEVLDALDDAGRKELAQITRALDLIEKGGYGTCAKCGEPISSARLSALPYAQYCIQCAEDAET